MNLKNGSSKKETICFVKSVGLFGKCESCQHLHLLVGGDATNYFLSKQESQLGLLSGCSTKHLLRIAEMALS